MEEPDDERAAVEIDGAVVSITIALLFPSEPEAPGAARVKVALFAAASLIVPPLRARDVVAA
jgi:hypothetical protein